MLIRSMRFRLTFLFVALFGGAQFVLWFVVDRVRTDYLLAELDRQLVRRAQGMLNALEEDHPETEQAVLVRDHTQGIGKRLRQFEEADFYFEVRDVGGDALLRSRNLTGFNLPFQVEERSPPGSALGPTLQTIHAPWESAPPEERGPLRLATVRDFPVDGEVLSLQAAVDLRPVLDAVAASRQLMVVFGIVGLILAAQTAWFITGRSLAPLRALTRMATGVSAARLGERSDGRHVDDEVGEAVAAVNGMLDRLEQEFNRLERFIANISHEIKTPLAVLLGEAQALRHRLSDANGADEFVVTVERETRKLLRTIDALLVLAQAKAHGRLPVTKSFALEDAALAAIHACRPNAESKSIRILAKFDADEDCAEPQVEGDFDLVRSMMENLLQNAIRHSPAESTIDLGITCTEADATVTIADRGPGISQGRLETIFDQFHLLDPRGKRVGASGLGLATVKAVAELHGGRVSARNRPEAGCEFAVSLPLSCAVSPTT